MDSTTPTVDRNWFAAVFLYAAVACYLISFFLPTYAISAPKHPLERDGEGFVREYSNHNGFSAFIVCLAPFVNSQASGTTTLPPLAVWMANPLSVIAAIVLMKGGRWAAIACSIAAACLASVFMGDDLLRIGYYVWWGSMILLNVSAILVDND